MPDAVACRALVVDDEATSREVVTTLLAEVPRVSVVGEAANGTDAARLIRDLRPDLLFLDIQMPDEDGFRLIHRLGDAVPRGIVFVTAFDTHAVRAFEHHALDYVLKPFGRPRFLAAVSRALDRLDAMDALSLVRTLGSIEGSARHAAAGTAELDLSVAPPPAARPSRIGVRIGNRTVIVDVASIDWIEASGDYARIHAGSASYLVSERLQALEQLLDDRFVRVHRSILVNLSRVQELHREGDGSGSVRLVDGVRLRVSRNRWDVLVQALAMPQI